MSKELKEMLNEIDHYCLDNDKHFYDFRSLYEAINKPLTPEQKTKIFNTAKDIKDGKINDPDVLDDVIDAVRIENDPTLKQQVNKKLNEEDKGEYEVFIYGQNRNVKKPITYFDTEAEAEDFCNDHDWTYIDPDSRFEWNMDYRIAPKKASDKEIYGFDLNEKLVEAPQEVIDDLISILNEYGFILDDSVGHENPSKSLLFGDTHIQVINPDSYIDTLSDDINVQEELQKYIPRNLINKIHELDQTSNCPITWNFGINKDGNVTGGLDVMKQYVEESLKEDLDISSYQQLSSTIRDNGNTYALFRKREDNKTKWAAAEYVNGSPDLEHAFEITYDQASGFEPLSKVGKISRDLGKKLLPKNESIKTKRINYCPHCRNNTLIEIEDGYYVCDECGAEYTGYPSFEGGLELKPVDDECLSEDLNLLHAKNGDKINFPIEPNMDIPEIGDMFRVGPCLGKCIDKNEKFVTMLVDHNSFNSSLKEASYGGAYDIEDDMFFTKEELMEFGYDLAEQFSTWADDSCELSDLYMTSPVDLVMEVAESDGAEHQAKVKIDMRKIRLPKDIEKYTDIILKQWKDSYNEYHDYDESLKEDTVKQNGKWVNKGDSGETHGKFATKKQADAQRKAMFASGYQGESLEEVYKHLNNREKQVYIDIINNPEECEDIDDLKDIVHEIFFYDKALFAMMNRFPKDASFEELKANKIAILKDSMLDESLNEDKIADKIISNQDSKEMTRRAIKMLKNLGGDYKDLEKEFEQTYHEKVFNESLEEDLVISPEKEYQSKSGHRILIKDVTPYMSEYDGTANLRIKYDYKLAGSDEWGSSECNQYDLFKMLNEDYERNDDEWGDPYSFDEVERELKKLTNNWSDEDGTIRCYYEQEKQYGVQILKKHYDIVETSDGRTGPGEEMSWVIAYAKPKAPLDESWTRDDYLRLEHDGYVDIDRVEDYIWAKYDGDLDDKKACARSLMNTEIYQDEGKVGIDVINEFAGAHDLVYREDFDESLDNEKEYKDFLDTHSNVNKNFNAKKYGKYFDKDGKLIPELAKEFKSLNLNESKSSYLKDKIIDCLDWFIEMEMEFPKNEFLADSWEDLKDGVNFGIDPEFEVAEGIVEYLKPIITFNKKYQKDIKEEGVFQDEIELYNNLVNAMNRYLQDNGYEPNIK